MANQARRAAGRTWNQELTSGTSQARRVRPERWLKGLGAHSSETPAAVVSAARVGGKQAGWVSQ